MARKEILYSIVSDLRSGEAAYLGYIYESGGCGEYVGRNAFWEETGLIRTVTDSEGGRAWLCMRRADGVSAGRGAALLSRIGTLSFLNSAVCAMTNLYGTVSCAKAYDIFREIALTDREIDYQTFTETAGRFAEFREECGVVTYQKNFVASEYMDVRIRSGIRRVAPLPSYYELISRQGDKPYYTELSVQTLLDYESPGSCALPHHAADLPNF